ncbi:MAG: TonB-dependent receptor [Bacteroidetes bacterium]|nr:MAG: TonB-dependent receptor [Bacteroidota bacterium]
MKKLYLLAGFLCFWGLFLSQENTQTIKGQVIDEESKGPIPGVMVAIIGTEPPIRTRTDFDGYFRLENLAPGRYDILVRYSGYKERVIPNVQVTSGKEVYLELEMKELINEVKEVVVSGTKKNQTINELATLSARSFSTEEVNRYAGGRSDPSRLAANFAGVSTPDDSRNDLVIRGNSPIGVLWRIEGLNIPNPNHFSTIGTTGGPVSGLNTNVLNNSDFFTSAFPAEYGNANAGVFDLRFRKGNSDKREHTIQFGMLTGIEAMTEGPIKKGNGSSYLVAYRYSFTGVAQAIGLNIGTTATPFYQDLSFKINSGKTKLGKFTLFGLAGTSQIDFKSEEVDTTDLFAAPNRDSYFTSQLGLIGLNHFARVNSKSYFKTVIGATYAGSNYDEDTVNTTLKSVYRVIENTTAQLRYIANTSYNIKVNPKVFLKFGLIDEIINLNLFYRNRTSSPDWIQIWDFNDMTSLWQSYAHMKYSFSDRWTMNIGVHAQYLTLNSSTSVEPRFGMKYRLNEKNHLSLGYGMHSQMQPTDIYFYRTQLMDGSYEQSNLDLDFTRSQHFVLAYDLYPFKDWRVKLESYYQMISQVPINSTPSSYSILNAGASFTPNEQGYLVNEGTGTNYGFELTLEKFFSKGYYGLLTGSVYQSTYKGSDGLEHPTAFDGRFVYNVLVGKEFKIGKTKQNRFSMDLKFTHAGGRPYTPIDLEASKLANRQIFKDDKYAYSERYDDFLRLDFKVGVTMNSTKRKLSHSLFFDIQNVTNRKNVFADRYNPNTNSINTAYQIGFFPNFVYKIQF